MSDKMPCVSVKKLYFLILILPALFLANCTYSTPEADNPVPGLEQSSVMGRVQNGTLSIRKSFFGVQINQEQNTWTYEDKTWMCGWAPTSQNGKYKNFGALTGAPYNTGHCNMVFRISDDGSNLEGLEVNVDKPNVADWQTLFTIPITQHYFYERVVDSRGRELNQFAKVSNRKNWQLQPFMDLDLKRISVVNRRKSPLVLWSPYSLMSSSFLSDVHDIEFTTEDNGKNFLGFTGTQISTVFGSDIQHEIRFNFLEFEGTRGFKPTAYDPNTVSSNMNILHILGTKEDGINEKNYAAHWDMSKPIEVCLNGFPENGRYKQIGVEVLNEVNRAMKEIGTLKDDQQGFVVSQKEYKYDFDLRCPNIHWVNDPELSFGAPLGIGLVNTNVKTGEILWGSAIVWGGLIDFLVNRDSESPVDALARNSYEVISSIQSSKHKPYYSDINHQLEMPDINNFRALSELPELNNPDELKTLFRDMMRARLEEVAQTNAVDANRAQAMQLEELSELIGLEEGVTEIAEHFQNQDVIDQAVASGQNIDVLRTQRMDQFINQKYNEIVAALPANLDNDQHEIYSDFQQNEAQYKRALLRKSELGNSVTYTEEEQSHRNLVVNQDNPEELRSKLKADLYHKMSQGLDWDNTIAHHYSDWLQATADMSMPEREEAAIGVIKNVMLHEWGHVLGLGHQFKGNILPERGTIPETLYQTLLTEAKEKKYYSSIMDYQSGRTETMIKPDEVELKTQDMLVMQYLYNQKVATYEPGEENFVMVDLPIDGSIPKTLPDNRGVLRQVRYMPQCSDIEAILATDPYCRRWDMGYDAPSIVQENYDQFKDSFIKRMNSFTQATGGNAGYVNWRLWHDSYTMMNYNRTFYDKMRFDMMDDLYRPSYARVFYKFAGDRDVLVQFSKACIDPRLGGEDYELDFATLVLQPTAKKTGKLLEIDRRSGDYASVNEENLSKFKSVMNQFGDKTVGELTAEEMQTLENDLYNEDVVFTDLHKLCQANAKALEQTKTLLALPGYDKTEFDFEGSVIPTGLRGANASADYSKIFGRFIKIGMLPLKLAALRVMTASSSTMRYGWWNIPKPKYSGSKGNYSYYSLYPEEYTDIVRTSVENNMSFGGTDLGDKSSLSLANLFMSYFLRSDQWFSRDKLRRGFDEIFLADVAGQTNFRVSLSPVLFEAIVDQDISDSIIFGFTPKIFSRAKNGLITLPEAYVLPHGNTIVRGTDGQIVMPLTKLRFIGPKTAYIWAVEITYEPTREGDPLQGFSVKNVIRTLSNKVVDECMGGENGLGSFFNKENRSTEEEGEDASQKFDGFTTSSNISVSGLTQQQFELSVIRQFEKYHSLRGAARPEQRECSESRNGLGLIGATALSLNGWILPQVFQYLE